MSWLNFTSTTFDIWHPNAILFINEQMYFKERKSISSRGTCNFNKLSSQHESLHDSSHHKNGYNLAKEMTGNTHNKLDNTTPHLCTFAIWAWIPLFFKAVTAFCATVGDSKSTNPYPVWIKWIILQLPVIDNFF